MTEENKIPVLEFSKKYSAGHSQQYYEKHSQGFWRNLSNYREISIARKALKMAGNPQSVLDLPCGAGRFWDMLAEDLNRKLYGSDNSEHMLEVAKAVRVPEVASRFETFQASAFDIPKKDNFVDSIFCMRLLHHIGKHEDRLKMLKEFHRVAKDTVIFSLWVDGNYKAMKRRKLDARRRAEGKLAYQNRFIVPQQLIESECREAGFDIVGHVDFLKFYAMWRVYVISKK
jgi:SAM-dependent methyltransferase